MADISLEAVTGKLNRVGYEAFIQALRQAKGAGNRNLELAHWLVHILQNNRSDLTLTVDHFQLDRAKMLMDLGDAIGCAAHMGALLRDAAGPFVLYESLTLDQIAAAPLDAIVPPERVIPLPTIVLDGRGAADFRAGRLVPLPTGAVAKHVFVRDNSRVLVGVGEAVGALLAPRKVFL